MAVEGKQDRPVRQHEAGRRVLFGTNVVVATLLVIGIVVVLQLTAHSMPIRWDMTSSGVNSLGDGTENLLRALDAKVSLTSLYFETDREQEDQPRYRRAVDDLLGLYEATNRAKVESDWVNPLKDHEKFKRLLARLRDRSAFKGEIEKYQERIDAYTNESQGLDARMRTLVQSEMERIASFGGLMGSDADQASVAPVENVLRHWIRELEVTRETVDSLMFLDEPQYTAAVDELKRVFRAFKKTLDDIGRHGAAQVAGNPGLSPEAADYLQNAAERYAELAETIEAESTRLQDLEPLKLDDLLSQLGPTSNAVLVETEEDALVVDFSSIWPPLDPNMSGPQVPFRNRAFKGEEKLTAAILRATHKEQTAVVFVRYGGDPLFMGGFVPGMPRAPYADMKRQLEDANFVVEEWDLKASETPPPIDPAPTRTIYVVFKPTPPERGPMGQPGQEPPFSESHKRALLNALGDLGRALFVVGWHPGPFGPMPSSYEYSDYLNDTWGVKVDTSAVLIQLESMEPGKFVPSRGVFNLSQVQVTDHDIVTGPQSPMLLPWCAPLELSGPAPEGVERFPLVIHPKREGVWGVHDLGQYETQLKERSYMTRVDDDLEGPFTLAAAAQKENAKVVVVSSRDFAMDQVAFAPELVLAPQGFQLRSRNAGNAALFINSLHWLNDNTQFMNVGRPIDLAVLEVESPSTVRGVQVLTIVVWPILALVCGGVAWWVRRR